MAQLAQLLELGKNPTCILFFIAGCLIYALARCNNLFGYFNSNARTAQNRTFEEYPCNSDRWTKSNSQAMGRLQSPINCKDSSCDLVSMAPLSFSVEYINVPIAMVLANDGYGLNLFAQFENGSPTVRGGPLTHPYRFHCAHFRWGRTDNEGSEHTINSKRYALEVQMLHVKVDFSGGNVQTSKQDKVALFISTLFDITVEDNPYLSPLVDRLDCIKRPNSKVHLAPFPFCWLFRPFAAGFYYYLGSFTLPPCTEGVQWIIQKEPMSVSSRQMKAFRHLDGYDGPMHTTSRPVQKINDRFIKFYT